MDDSELVILNDLSDVTTNSIINFISRNFSENGLVNFDYNESFAAYDGLAEKRDSLWIVIPLSIIYGLIFLTGLIGNVSTCIVIARNRAMHTATNYYLFSLAVSDLLLLVTGLPQEIYFLWSRYPYIFGEAFCVLRGLAAETSANATVLTITAFTIERYVAICHPFLSHTMSKLSRAVKLILIIWFVSLTFAIPQALQVGVIDGMVCAVKQTIIAHSFELSTLLFFIVPMTLITVLYVLIALRLRSSNMMKKESTSSCSTMGSRHLHSSKAGNNHCRHHGQSSRRVIKMLVAVVVAFFVCWAPFHAQRLVAIYGTLDHRSESQQPFMLMVYEIVTYASGVLYYLSTTVNPVLYHIMSNKFREAFKETFSQWCCGLVASGRAPSTYSMLSRRGQQRAAAAGAPGVHQDNSTTDYSGNSIVLREDSASVGPKSTHSRSTTYSNMYGTSSTPATGRKGYGGGGSTSCSRNGPETSETDCNGGYSTASQQHSQYRMSHSSPQSGQIKMHTMKVIHVARSPRPKGSRLWSAFDCTKKTKQSQKMVRRNHGMARCCAVTEFDLDPIQFGRSSADGNDDDSLTHCRISNSSLRDVEGGALEDELAAYMQEIHRRERS